jgi:hypothetical protein
MPIEPARGHQASKTPVVISIAQNVIGLTIHTKGVVADIKNVIDLAK